MKLGEAWVYINGDDKPLQGVFRNARRSAESWAGGVSRSIRTILGGALQVATGFLGAQLAARAWQATMGDLLPAARGARDAHRQLEAVLRSTGQAAGLTIEELEALAGEMQNLTSFEDDAVAGAEALLLTFTNIGGEIFPQALESTLDLSVAFKQDLKNSAIQLGKALNDPILGVTALQRVGVAFTESQREQIRVLVESGQVAKAQGMILAELQRQVGGSARALADPIVQVTNVLGDFKEIVGGELLQFLDRLALTALPYLRRAVDGLPGVIERAKGSIREWATVWIERLTSAGVATAGILGRVAGYMSVFARYALSWGLNIGEMLAKGLLMAVSAVAQALAVLGRVVTSLLKPGSPPRLLPDLDQWGKGWAEVLLSGFTQADMSALVAFGSTVQTMLAGLAGAGRMEEGEVAPRTLALRETFAEILHQIRETGQVSEEFYAAIREGAGEAGPELEELARRYARVAEAQGRLAGIEERLRALRGAQQERQDTARLAQLAAIMADPRATAAQKERAEREREMIGLIGEQREAQEEMDAAQGELGAFQSRLDVERETLSLLAEQRSLLGDLVGGLQSVLDPLAEAVRGWQMQQQELRDLVRLAEIEHTLANESLTVAQETALELERQAIQAERLVRARDAAEIGVDLTGLSQIPIVPADFLSQVGGALTGEGGLGDVVQTALDEVDAQLEGFDLGGLEATLGEIRTRFEEEFGAAQEAAQELMDGMPEADSVMGPLFEALEGLEQRLGDLEGPLGTTAAGLEKVADAVERLSGVLGRDGEESLLGWLVRVIGETMDLSRRRMEPFRKAWDNLS
ncbi:MAG: hypothetical protein GX657_14460, partial [Chloroflexi bacterium]|nr:hypothetical protein [Chloroflexota bacterium]